MTFSFCGCSQRRITKTAVTKVAEETAGVAPKIVMLKSTASEPAIIPDGMTDKHIACVIRVSGDSVSTLLVNIYDERGRLSSTTSEDITHDYEYDENELPSKASKYFKGLYQGCIWHSYVGNRHFVTSYSADGSVVYGGETYEEYVNNSGYPSTKIVYINEKEHYTSMVKDYDRKTGWIVTESIRGPEDVIKELKHSYKQGESGNLVETVVDKVTGKTVSETTYMGPKRLDDRILRYEEYDSDGNTIRGYENNYVEINGRNVLESKAEMEMDSDSGKIKADIYFYSMPEFDIENEIFEYLGMESTDFSGLTVHLVTSGYDDASITYGSGGIRLKTVTSKKDSSGRVVQVKEIGRNGTQTSLTSFKYDESGNCTKMTVMKENDTVEYFFGYITLPNVYCEPFGCAQAEEYIGK